jgi:hypothetical protein
LPPVHATDHEGLLRVRSSPFAKASANGRYLRF